jgi:hypothetical protein
MRTQTTNLFLVEDLEDVGRTGSTPSVTDSGAPVERFAIRELPHVLVFDNSDLLEPFRKVAEFELGEPVTLNRPLPRWLPWP